MGKARRERQALAAEVTSYAMVPIMAQPHEIREARAKTRELAIKQAGDRGRGQVQWREWPSTEVGAIMPMLFPHPTPYEQKLVDNALAYAHAFPDSWLIVAQIEVAMPPGTPIRHQFTEATEPPSVDEALADAYIEFVRKGPQ